MALQKHVASLLEGPPRRSAFSPVDGVPAADVVRKKVDLAVELRVSEGSPAHAAGLRDKDLLLEVDGVPAVMADATSKLEPAEGRRRRFLCYSAASNELVDIVGGPGSGTALGASTSLTVAAALRTLRGGSGRVPWTTKYAALVVLWQSGRWKELLDVTSKETGIKPKSLGLWKFLPASLIGVKFNTPYLAAEGAAMAALGEPEAGKLLRMYIEKYEECHTTDFMAIARIHLAEVVLKQRKAGAELPEAHAKLVLELLFGAANFLGLEKNDANWLQLKRVATIAAEAGVAHALEIDKPPPRKPIAAPLPSVGIGSLVDTSKLRADQIHMVILLANYRANGPYHELLAELSRVAPAVVPRWLTGCTMLSWGNRASQWVRNEKALVKRGFPIDVKIGLSPHEGEAFLLALEVALEEEIESSPFVFFVTQKRRICGVFDMGSSVETGIWEVLSQLEP